MSYINFLALISFAVLMQGCEMGLGQVKPLAEAHTKVELEASKGNTPSAQSKPYIDVGEGVGMDLDF
ncbi:hypothetical protein [Candidatus Thioglobus autotrophicus]|uniref:hypothetical protein n=1 Tax=Candidatus Thioglobus autotrophicus TaxID=1705394 RepID=UPI00299DEF22|nr:hypothetical protein [Candidatus Thioglobus autotrophicus]WPE16355.1 hypothetical protein R5P06_07330 [Candidatus Thioglobus autotrophicus]WPE17902.1 hypothetical protein R5P05_07485 [Candidatus Thioglobus autotrophicus]